MKTTNALALLLTFAVPSVALAGETGQQKTVNPRAISNRTTKPTPRPKGHPSTTSGAKRGGGTGVKLPSTRSPRTGQQSSPPRNSVSNRR